MSQTKLEGIDQFCRELNKEVINIIRTNLDSVMQEYIDDMLLSNSDATGRRLPQKKEETKKAYAKKGLDTTHWLIASGYGKHLQKKLITNGIVYYPRGQDYMKYVKRSEDVFVGNDKVLRKIIKKIEEKMNL